MDDANEVPPLDLGEVRFEITTQTRKRLFGRRPKALLMVQVAVPGYQMAFDYRELRDLDDGPLLIEAISSFPDGDYFLASPSVIEPSSPVGASLQEQRFSADSLLLLQGGNLLAELSATQQKELIVWLGSVRGA